MSSKLPDSHPAKRHTFHVVACRATLPGIEQAYVLFNGKTRNIVDGRLPRCLEEAMRAAFDREGTSGREVRPIVVYRAHPQKVDRAGDLRGVIDVTEEEVQVALAAKRLIDALYTLAEPTATARAAADATGHAPSRAALDRLRDADAGAMAEALAYYATVGMEQRIRPWNPFAAEARRLATDRAGGVPGGTPAPVGAAAP